MSKRPARLWFVASGPDSRHLQDVTAHAKAREAVAVYKANQAKAKQLFSLDFLPWQNGHNRRTIKEQVN